MARERQELVRELIASPADAAVLVEQLRDHPWDSEEQLVTLRADDLRRVLRQFDRGELSAEQVAAWADALEMRDDVELDPDCEEAVRDAVFVLANPDLEGALNPEKAAALLKLLPDAAA